MRTLLPGWALVAAASVVACSNPTVVDQPLGRSPADGGSGDGAALRPYPMDARLHLNELQIKATHNSYHVEKPGNLIPQWKYSRDPLAMQLGEQGVRGVELDTHFMEATGTLDVFHVAGGDDNTTCQHFVECLGQLKAWSDAHPGHHPLFVQIEPKEPSLNQTPDFVAYSDAMDAEILSVWPRSRVITPADVQGSAATLREAVTTKGWPTLGASRGKVLFYSNDRTTFHAAYTRGGADIHGRVLFPESHPDEPIAAVVILNTPDLATADVVKQGFIVRTMCDGVPIPADAEARRKTALDSGAQIISTDFPIPLAGVDPVGLTIPGGSPSRCNPINAPTGCTPQAVENPIDLLSAL